MSCKITYKGQEFTSVEDFSQTLQNNKFENAASAIPEYNDRKSLEAYLKNTFALVKPDDRFQVTSHQKEALEIWRKRFDLPLNLIFKQLEEFPNEYYLQVFPMEGTTFESYRQGYREEISTSSQKAISAVEALQKVFPALKYTVVPVESLNQAEHSSPIKDIKSYIKGNTIHLVEGRFTSEIAIEEALHPFVHALKIDNPETYANLLEQAQKADPNLFTSVQAEYSGLEDYDISDIAEEFLTQSLARAYAQNKKILGPSEYGLKQDLLFRFLELLENLFYKATRLANLKNVGYLAIYNKMTIKDVVEHLQTTKKETWVKVDGNFKRYSKGSTDSSNGLEDQPDEKALRRKVDFKIKKAQDQIDLLDKLNDRGNQKQKLTIEGLRKASVDYKTQLESEKEYIEKHGKPLATSVSVSKFIGNTEFDGDMTMYQKFADFGTFMHNFLEDITDEILHSDDNKLAFEFLTREKFDAALEKHQKSKNGFEIENLSADEMYQQAREILQVMITNFTNGNIVIPEFTVMATYGEKSEVVTGRLDVMVIDHFGKVNVKDFKTKKVKQLVGESGLKNIEAVHTELSTNEKPINELDGTHPSFANLHRTTFDTWNVQLKVYERMLAQNGVPVGDASIIALLYQTDSDLIYTSGQVFHYEGNFYDAVDGMVLINGEPHSRYSEIGMQHYAKFEKAVKKSIPIANEKQEEMLATKGDRYLLDFSKDELFRFLDVLEKSVEQELKKLQERKSQLFATKTPEGERMYTDEQIESLVNTQRIRTLKSFTSATQRIKSDYNDPDVPNLVRKVTVSAQLKFLMTTIEADLNSLFLKSKSIQEKLRSDKKEFLGKRDDAAARGAAFKERLDYGKYAEEYRQVLMNTQNMEATINFLRTFIAEGRYEGKIDNNSPMYKMISDFSSSTSNIVEEYKKFAIDVFAEIIMSVNTDHGFAQISSQAREALVPELERMKRKRDKLLSNGSLSKMEKLRLATMKLLNPEMHAKLNSQYNTPQKQEAYQLEQVENEILVLEAKINNGYEYSHDFIKNLISGITDKNSQSYVGRNRKGIAGFQNDSWIAGASNSDMGIAGVSNFLKIATEMAKDEFMNFMQENNFQELKDNFSKGRNIQEMNEMLTEKTEHLTLNDDGSIDKDTNASVLSYVSPIAQEHSLKIEEFRLKKIKLNKEIDEAKQHVATDTHKTFMYRGDVGLQLDIETDAFKELKKLYVQRDKLFQDEREHLKNVIELPYVDDYYALYDIPFAFMVELNDVKIELEALELYRDEDPSLSSIRTFLRATGDQTLGAMDTSEIEEMVLDRIADLHIERKKIRERAANINPRYAELIDLKQEFMSYDTVRQNAFDAMRSQKEQEFADNPELLAKWMSENTILEATEEYYEEIKALYEAREMIGTRDEELSDLFKERNEQLKPYRTALGNLYGHIPEVELAELDRIQSEITSRLALLKASKVNRLTEGERKLKADIDAQLTSLQREQINQKYQTEKDRFIEMLSVRRTRLKRAERGAQTILEQTDGSNTTEDTFSRANALRKLDIENTQWVNTKRKFNDWYSKYHAPDNLVTRSFNYDLDVANPNFGNLREYLNEKVPAQDHHRVEKPNSKWRKGEVKEAAINPNHKKLPNGMSLPKALTIDADGNVALRPGYTGSMEGVNPKFIKILQDKDASAFYNVMISQYFKMQNRTSGKKRGYAVPGKAATFVQNMMEHKGDLVKLAKREIAKKLDNAFFKSVSETDQLTNEYGENLDNTRFRFNNQFSEDIQGFDAINATFNWMYEAHINEGMNLIKNQVDVALDGVRLMRQHMESNDANTMEDKVRLKELQDLYDNLEYERNKHIAGVYEKNEYRRLKKLIDATFGIISFGRLAFSVTGQVKNAWAGNVQILLGAASSEYYDFDDYKWAKAQMYSKDGFFGNYMADWGKIGDLSQQTMLYRKFNPLQKDYNDYLDDSTGGAKMKRIERGMDVNQWGYFIQDRGDSAIGMTIWLAVMKNMQVPVTELNAQGERVPVLAPDGEVATRTLYDVYQKDSKGRLIMDPALGDLSEYELRAKKVTWAEIRRTQGNYAKMDQPKAASTIVGRMQLFYRKFLIPQLVSRFGYGREDWEAERYTKGYWRVMLSIGREWGTKEAFKHLILGGGGAKKIENTKVNSWHARHAMHASRDFYTSIVLTMLASFLTSVVRSAKEDGEELPWITNHLIQLMWGIRQETTAFTPIPMVMNVDEYMRSISSYSTAFGDITKISKMGTHALMAMIGSVVDEEDSEFWGEILHDHYFQRKSGAFEEGTAKVFKDIYDLSGYKNIDNIINPDYRISNMMKYQ
jgi:hypothetical protein